MDIEEVALGNIRKAELVCFGEVVKYKSRFHIVIMVDDGKAHDTVKLVNLGSGRLTEVSFGTEVEICPKAKLVIA